MKHQPTSRRHGWIGSDAGLSMVVTVISLGITALLVALLLTTTLKSGTNSNTGVSNAPGVAEATALQAQQTLSTSLTTADAEARSGGYASLSASALSASNPSISFVDGPSTNSTTVSVAVVGGAAGGGAASTGSDNGIAGVAGGGDVSGGAGGVSGSGGSVTLADRSADGTCWLIWKSAQTATWYGAQTHLSSCTAPALASAPAPGPVSSATIGWQPGTFPDA